MDGNKLRQFVRVKAMRSCHSKISRKNTLPYFRGSHSCKTTIAAETTIHGQPLLGFLVQGMRPARRAILLERQFIGRFSLILCRSVVPVFTCFTGQGYNIPHSRLVSSYSIISLITPAPTVLPPSRIANRSSFSIAIGVIKLTSIETLSPGITISTPSGNVTTPVTSVVRK